MEVGDVDLVGKPGGQVERVQMSMSEPSKGVRSDKTDAQWNTCRFRLETWIALTTRPVDQLLRATKSSMAVMTDCGKQFSSVLCAALVGCAHAQALTEAKRVACSRGVVWSQQMLSREMDTGAGRRQKISFMDTHRRAEVFKNVPSELWSAA